MIRRAPPWISIASASILASNAAAYQTVLVVDRHGGGQFTEIQEAVLAAHDGDTILVRVPQGTWYTQAVEVVDKALTIAVDSTTQLVDVRRLRVRNLAGGKTVVLTRLHANSFGIGFGPYPSIELDNNAGSVRLVSCGSKGSYWDATPGLSIESSSGPVAFSDCTIEGGGGADGDESDGMAGGPGLALLDGIAAAYDSSIFGGKGGDVYIGWFAGPGGPGADIASNLFSTRLFTQNVLFRGGVGGADLDCFLPPDVGAAGGTGFVQRVGATTTLLDTLLEGGAGGSATCGPDGPPGAAVDDSGTLLAFAGPHVSLETPTIGREGEVITLRFTGTPGDRVFLIAGHKTTFVEGSGDALIVEPDSSILASASPLPVGRIGWSGTLDLRFTLPEVPSVPGAMNLWFQALAEHPDLTQTLGSFAVVTALDSAY